MSGKQKKYPAALQEVENSLSMLPLLKAPDPKFNLQSYIGTAFPVLGITTPQTRDRFRQGYTFSALPADEQYAIWKYIWQHSRQFDTMTQALYFLEKQAQHFEPVWLCSELQQWLERIDNWAHSDMLTHHFAALMESSPALMYPILQRWNTDPNPWKRRQSILSLLDYARFRKKYPAFTKIIRLVTPLLNDPDVFVQKGVGWCLRECHAVYPEHTLQYVFKQHARLSSIAFASATEKYPKAQKEKLKSLRKKSRKR